MIAIITGASAGIGEATAHALAEIGYDIIITGRRKERLDELQSEIESKYNVKALPLAFDVRNYEETKQALEGLPTEWSSVDVLVNNAGLAAGLEPVQEGKVDNWERMIDTNIKGLLYVTRTIAPGMIKRQKGHILNVGSIAGKEVYANGNVYCATKHAVDALSRGMRLDMVHDGIKVTNIAPGLVETEFSLVRFDWDSDKAKNVYQGFVPLSGKDIADCIAFAVTRPAHVTIADMLIFPTAQGSATTIAKK
tara:strand:+ start:185 stop:937 length:753 start_codon:yes stop_codon:yes gene_type:complete